MPGILKIFAVARKNVTSGEILNRQADNMFNVKIGSRTLKIKSAVSEPLDIGTRVVVAKTDEGRFIVGAGDIQNRGRQEVAIDG